MPTTHKFPKNTDGGLFRPDVSKVLPGDTIELEGDYAYISFDKLVGSATAPITIRNKGKVTVGTNNASQYGLHFMNSRYIVVDGSGDPLNKYGLVFHSGSTTTVTNTLPSGRKITGYKGSAIITGNTSDIEIKFCEITKASAGIFGNPATGNTMYNVNIHDNWIHDIKNGMQETAEGIYLGNTGITVVNQPAHFENIRIVGNLLEDLGGDGIQICNAQLYVISGNVVKNYGNQNFSWQQTGILAGGQSYGVISTNIITDGTGSGIQVFGYSLNKVFSNQILRTSTAANQDAIYIEKKAANDGAPLQVDVYDNVIDGAARDGIRNASITTTGKKGLWGNNTITNVKGVAVNAGVVGFDPYVATPAPVPPTPTPTPTPAPQKKVMQINDNFTWEWKAI